MMRMGTLLTVQGMASADGMQFKEIIATVISTIRLKETNVYVRVTIAKRSQMGTLTLKS